MTSKTSTSVTTKISSSTLKSLVTGIAFVSASVTSGSDDESSETGNTIKSLSSSSKAAFASSAAGTAVGPVLLTAAGPSGSSGIESVGDKANNNVKDEVRCKAAKENKYVSNQEGITKTENLLLAKLCVKLKTPSKYGNARFACWQYFGLLTDSRTGKILDAHNYHCKVCLEECQTANPQAVSDSAC